MGELLTLEHVDACYGEVQVTWDCSFNVSQGEVVALLGGNGAGKTTLLRTISGLIKPKAGRVLLDGRDVSRLEPHRLPELGLVHVPEGRHVFSQMTVQENLDMGAFAPRARAQRGERLNTVFELFPALKERRRSLAGALSGGQQQMLALARGLMGNPKLLLLDEPSLGLAPAIVLSLFEIILQIKALGVTVLLVEQNYAQSMEVADRYYLISSGRMVTGSAPGKQDEDLALRRAYLGV